MKGLKKYPWGGGSIQRLYGGTKSVLGLFLVQSFCSSGPRVRVVEEAFWVYVYKVIVDFVEHPPGESVVFVVQALSVQGFRAWM